MPTLYKTTDSQQKELFIEFPDNWSAHLNLPRQDMERQLIQHIFQTVLSNRKLDPCDHFQLHDIKLKATCYSIFLCEKHNKENFWLIAVPNTDTAADVITHKVLSLMEEEQLQALKIDEKQYQQWLAITEQPDNIKLKTALTALIHESYEEITNKTLEMVNIKAALLEILLKTAFRYYQILLTTENQIGPSDQASFNELFDGIAKIADHHVEPEPNDASQRTLRDIAKLFNLLLTKLNTIIYRIRSDPYRLLQTHIKEFHERHPTPEPYIKLENYQILFSHALIDKESATQLACAWIRNRVQSACQRLFINSDLINQLETKQAQTIPNRNALRLWKPRLATIEEPPSENELNLKM